MKEVKETFGKPNMPYIRKEPSCINFVSVRKYRITIEEIPESDEVIKKRLLKMYKETDNHHRKNMIERWAIKNGIDL